MGSQISTTSTAIIYSFITFSIVFTVLGGLTAVIYAMHDNQQRTGKAL
jgi:hypothetical protein